MSWRFESYSTSMTLAGVADAAAFKRLLTQYASSLLPDLLDDEDHYLWSSLGWFRDDALGVDDEGELLEMLVESLECFVSTFYVEGGPACISISSNNNHQDLVEALAFFLLPYATEPYVVLCSASFHLNSGSFYQSLLYRSGGRMVTVSVSNVIQRLFGNPEAPAGTLLPWTPEALVPVPA